MAGTSWVRLARFTQRLATERPLSTAPISRWQVRASVSSASDVIPLASPIPAPTSIPIATRVPAPCPSSSCLSTWSRGRPSASAPSISGGMSARLPGWQGKGSTSTNSPTPHAARLTAACAPAPSSPTTATRRPASLSRDSASGSPAAWSRASNGPILESCHASGWSPRSSSPASAKPSSWRLSSSGSREGRTAATSAKLRLPSSSGRILSRKKVVDAPSIRAACVSDRNSNAPLPNGTTSIPGAGR